VIPSASKELFFDPPAQSVAARTLQKSWSLPASPNNPVSQKISFSYPEKGRKNSFDFSPLLSNAIAPMLQKYRREDPRAQVLQRFEENTTDFGNNEYESRTAVEIFALNPSTLTLRIDEGGYGGGAHGWFASSFLNLERKSGRKLTLKDLLRGDFNATLTRRAEAAYRRARGLAPEQSLIDDGWFENRFVLAENFAVTSRGLYFLYNQYEIKPYASGQTTFLLPYEAIRDLIDPRGPLAFALHPHRPIGADFIAADLLQLHLRAKSAADGSVTLRVDASNLSYAKHGWLSLTFPDLRSAAKVKILSNAGFGSLLAYPAGTPVSARKHRRPIPARVLLVEGEDRDWTHDKNDGVELLLHPPRGLRVLRVQLRASFRGRADDSFLRWPKLDESPLRDQQGYAVRQIGISLR